MLNYVHIYTPMYTLRKITSEGIEMNFNLGNSYTIITQATPDKFNKTYELLYKDKPKDEQAQEYGFVTGEDLKIHSLYKNHYNYIMTDSGKTFSNISMK